MADFLLTGPLRRLLAPQQSGCHLCGALLVEGEHTLCGPCQAALNGCEVPAVDAASREYRPIGLAISAFWHHGEARALVHRLKYNHDSAAALPLAHGMCRAYAGCIVSFPRPDAVVAVPVHASRLRTRGYNQAELLARVFCGHTGFALLPDALLRTRQSGSQVYRGRAGRLAAMEGAFEAPHALGGLGLLLVDDVFTTGATAMACAQCLLEAGAERVDLLTACKA